MKKVLILLILLLTSCSNKPDILYYKLVEELNVINTSSSDIPFSINITVEELTDMELIYHVIIDEPKVSAEAMTVLVSHDIVTDNVFPSIGIVDDKVDLLVNKVDTSNNSFKGIALVGYLPNDNFDEINFKVRIEYEDNKHNKYINYYVHKVTTIDNK